MTLVPLAAHVPGGAAIVPAIALGFLALVLTASDMRRLGRGLIVAGWAVFALTTASSEFPTVLRPVGVCVVGVGVILNVIARDPKRSETSNGVAFSTRLVVVYVVLVLVGCLVSPYGVKNLARWIEGTAIVAGGFYGVALGLTEALLAATFAASALNVLLTLQSGITEQPEGNVPGPSRLTGYMQANHLAFAATIVLLGIAWALVHIRSTPVRLALVVLSLPTAYVLYASRSRAGLLALALGLGVAAVVWSRDRGWRPWRSVLASTPALVVLVPLVGRQISKLITRGGSSSLTSLTGRTSFWPLVVHLIGQRPVIGWGIDIVAFPKYAAQFQAITPGAVQAHNAFLEAGLMAGVPGAVVFALCLLTVLVGALRLRPTNRYRLLIVALTLVIICFSFTESGPAWFGDMFIIVVLAAATYGAEWSKERHVQPAPAPMAVARSDANR